MALLYNVFEENQLPEKSPLDVLSSGPSRAPPWRLSSTSTLQKKFGNTLSFFYANKIKFCSIICSTFDG